MIMVRSVVAQFELFYSWYLHGLNICELEKKTRFLQKEKINFTLMALWIDKIAASGILQIHII